MTERCGIILAGGSGTRLYPVTQAISKQLMPVYDKPMIYYPLSTLMLSGIRDVLVISSPGDTTRFEQLLGDGSRWGMNITHAKQPRPDGLAQAFVIGREFVAGRPSALALGDNLFHGHDFPKVLREADARESGAVIFAYRVTDPQRYGVIGFDDAGHPSTLEEKPAVPRSSHAVTGLYYYDDQVCDIAASLRPSARGEYEISDVNRTYLERGNLHVEILGRGFTWLDTGTHDSLLEAASFIATLQRRQGVIIASPEEVALQNGWLSPSELTQLVAPIANTAYGRYLLSLVG